MKFLSYTGSLLLALTVLTMTVAAQSTFTNSTAIIINDGTEANPTAIASPYPSAINVSGLSGAIAAAPGSVKVRINNLTHTAASDIGIALVGPTGRAFLLQDFAGSGKLDNITYTLSDDAAETLPNLGAWKNGAYKPTAYFDDEFPAPGPGSNYNTPQFVGAATFSSTYGGTNPNGEWKLFVIDFETGDSGRIDGGWSLTITTTGGNSVARKANVDMNGDGKTDFAITRQTSTPFAENQFVSNSRNTRARSFRERQRFQQTGNAAEAAEYRYWYLNNNGTDSYDVIPFGTVGDLEVPEDYDGDGKDDIAVWRGGAAGQAAFYILQSKTGTFRLEPFGQDGDDPQITGDYDGDKIADVATFRCPQKSAGQCSFFYRGSLNNPNKGISFVNLGFGVVGDFNVNPGDFDGDGKYDFCLQRNLGGNRGQFVLLRSSDFKDEYINWGLADDFIVPGDYDGDGKADFMVVRRANGRLNWFLLTRAGGGTGAIATVWGLADDFMTPGDFDGDGKTDIAVWRPNPDPTQNFYYILRSSSQTFQSVEWGMDIDFPVQNWKVH